MGRRAQLALEILVFFILVPALIFFHRLPRQPLLYIVGGLAAALWLLRREPEADRAAIFRVEGAWPEVRRSLLRCAVFAVPLVAIAFLVEPGRFFSFPRERPGIWAAVVVLYPFLSAFPQEVIFRAFFFRRYRPLFSDADGMVIASAFFFAFTHIIFFSPLSFALSFFGGMLFGDRYRKTGMLIVPTVEHSLLGLTIFTAGLGRHFYHGAA